MLQHGVVDPSDSFVVRGSELSPGFYLANSGYDVWAANSRGSTYSQNHTILDPDTDPEFYEFSFPDLMLDNQANIEYILDQTGLQTLSYFGFNSGGSSMYVGLIQQNEWFAQRVNLFISFGAIVRVNYMYDPFTPFYQNPLPLKILRRFNITRFPPAGEYFRNVESLI